MWRNSPGLQLKDVYNVNPGSFDFRHVAPGNMSRSPEDTPQFYRQDY